MTQRTQRCQSPARFLNPSITATAEPIPRTLHLIETAAVIMRIACLVLTSLLTLAACDAAKRLPVVPVPITAENADSVFNAMDHRHVDATGASMTPLRHQFEPVPEGANIVLERGEHDDMGISQIRLHLLQISRAFKRGEFDFRGFIHAQPVPGADVMAEQSGKIEYAVEDLPHGAALRIRTSDPEALRAVHSFIAFQIAEHSTAK